MRMNEYIQDLTFLSAEYETFFIHPVNKGLFCLLLLMIFSYSSLLPMQKLFLICIVAIITTINYSGAKDHNCYLYFLMALISRSLFYCVK